MHFLRILFLNLIFFPATVQAQIIFQKTIGTVGPDYGYSVKQTFDAGYIIVGTVYDSLTTFYDVCLIKTNEYGDTLWTKNFGGPDNDEGNSVQQTADSGFIICGTTRSFSAGDFDIYLIKTNIDGVLEWAKSFGGSSNENSPFVNQTLNGGYIITAQTSSFGSGSSDIYLICTDAFGDSIWTKTYGGIEYDGGGYVKQTVDTGFIISGFTLSFGSGDADIYLVKVNSVGDLQWSRTFGGIGPDYGGIVMQNADTGFSIVAGTSSYGAGLGDIILIKTDSVGQLLWSKTFGGSSPEGVSSYQQTTDKGAIILGRSWSFGAVHDDIYLIKTDSIGNLEWSKTFTGNSYDEGYSVSQTRDGGYIITGETESYGAGSYDIFLIKTDSSGNGLCNEFNPLTIFNSTAIQTSSPNTIENSSSSIITIPNSIIWSGLIVGTLCSSVYIPVAADSSINIFPNPTKNQLTVRNKQCAINSISIYNMIGEISFTIENSNDLQFALDISEIPAGIYFIKLETEKGTTVQKFIKQ